MSDSDRILDDLPSEVMFVAAARGYAITMDDATAIARAVRVAGLNLGTEAFRSLVLELSAERASVRPNLP